MNPRYREAVKRLLGKGVLEGYWEEQERLALRIYCLTAIDPYPTARPMPLRGSEAYCSRLWRELGHTYDTYRDIIDSTLKPV